MAAVLAGRDMPAERRGAAALDGGHDLQLAEAQVAGIGSTPGSAMGAEDIRDLQPFPGHEIPDQAGGRGPCLRYSKGLLTAFKVVLAMWL
jgi:hypothetical protein